MKSLILLINVLFLGVLASHAQNKVDNTINKANNSLNSVNTSTTNAAATATNAATTITTTASTVKDVGNKFGTLFGKKHMASDDVVSTTEITVEGANYSTLNKLDESIEGCPGVQDSKVKFNATQSTIIVTHTGSTHKLLVALKKKSPALVGDDQVVSEEDGKLDLKLK